MLSREELQTRESAAQALELGLLGVSSLSLLSAPYFLERGGPGSRAGRYMGQERGSVHMLLSQVASALFDGPLGPEELCHMAAQATQQCCKGQGQGGRAIWESDFWIGLSLSLYVRGGNTWLKNLL